MRIKNRWLLGIGVTLAALLWPVTTAQAATYSFNLNPPNTAEDGSAGQTIRVTGAGKFDTNLEVALANGSYSIRNSAGKVIERGTFGDASFVDFESFGGPNPGLQGGVLHITVTLFPNNGAPIEDVPMTVTCLINAPPGFEEGTTVGAFTEKTGGNTVFHFIKP